MADEKKKLKDLSVDKIVKALYAAVDASEGTQEQTLKELAKVIRRRGSAFNRKVQTAFKHKCVPS